MACILHIETSTEICSVALSQDGTSLFQKTNREGMQAATLLAPYVEEAMHPHDCPPHLASDVCAGVAL